MAENRIIVIGDYIEPGDSSLFDLSSTLRLKARAIDQRKLWESKDCSAEFMGNIWSLFLEPEKEEKIKTVLHSICVELIENSAKYGYQDYDYVITIDLALNTNQLLVYVKNNCNPSHLTELQNCAHAVLDTDDIRKLFKKKLHEAKAAKKQGQSKSQLGFIRIVMQNVKLAWHIEVEPNNATITTLAVISLSNHGA